MAGVGLYPLHRLCQAGPFLPCSCQHPLPHGQRRVYLGVTAEFHLFPPPPPEPEQGPSTQVTWTVWRLYTLTTWNRKL